MATYSRYAIYIAPEPGSFAAFGAAWLGWDPETGRDSDHPEMPNLPRSIADLTAQPRKYGFHGTLKPPFRLAAGHSVEVLQAAVADLAARHAPVTAAALQLQRLGRFLALVPVGETTALSTLAATCVRDLDKFRAPLTAEELAKRRGKGLSPAREDNLMRWGYPFVMDDFRFHMTLTGPLSTGEAKSVCAALDAELMPLVPRPFAITSICLFGERLDGRFEILRRCALSG